MDIPLNDIAVKVHKCTKYDKVLEVVFLTLCWYPVYCFRVVERTKSEKNISETIIENVIILDFLIADILSK